MKPALPGPPPRLPGTRAPGFCSLLMALALLAASGAVPHATAAAFLHIEGVPGESTEAAHPKWIQVSGVQQALDASGPVTARRASSSLRLIKQVDLATPLLAAAVASPQTFPKAELELTVPAAGQQTVFYRVELANVRVLAHATQTRPDGSTHEDVTLGFDRATWTYTRLSPDSGQALSLHRATWDFLRNAGSTSESRAGFTVRSITLSTGKLGAEWTPVPGRRYVLRQSLSPAGPYEAVTRIEPATTAEPRWVELPAGHPFAFFLLEEE